MSSPNRRSAIGNPQSAIRNRSQRRGVLLLVVLSMLVLFMLIGTAFLMTSDQYRTAATGAAKADRVGTPPDKLLNRALMQVLRDTNNSESSARYHSLLRDLYGTDGFEAEVYQPEASYTTGPSGELVVTRFAGAVDGTTAQQLGPTHGQFVDIYFKQVGYNLGTGRSLNDPLTPPDESSGSTMISTPDARHVLKLERDVEDQPQVANLPLTKGYYNGCLLTVTSGPARGQSARIVDYQFVGQYPATGTVVTRLFRLRVMAVSRADGVPLQIGARPPEIGDLIVSQRDAIGSLRGATFIVNGRPYNGTGVGYNPLAAVGRPKLTALELLQFDTTRGGYVGAELALLPNARYFNWESVGAYKLNQDPFFNLGASTDYVLLNQIVNNQIAIDQYPSYVGRGDADESYDAPDYQNMFLALETVAPRSRGRVVQPDDGDTTDGDTLPDSLEVDDPRVMDNAGRFIYTDRFLRLDLEDVPLPSFHRPALVNFWYHRMLNAPWLQAEIPNDNQRAKAILQPYDENGAPSQWVPSIDVAAKITAIKRQVMMRPLPEDNPDFDGGNPQSRFVERGLASGGTVIAPSTAFPNLQFAVPYWEAVGPWDVDNDNDGVPDSVWIDLGDPVEAAEDGTLYKPLYAFLIVDLDSRLNVNAHGLVDDLYPVQLDPTGGMPGNLAHDAYDTNKTVAQAVGTTNVLAQGIGYGPAEISLRPLFPAPLTQAGTASYGNRREDASGDNVQDVTNGDWPVDDYATLLAGRVTVDGQFVTGRNGLDSEPTDDFTSPFPFDTAPGITSASPLLGTVGPPDVLTQLSMFGYPQFVSNYGALNYVASSFSTPPDLMGRYALGLDYAGQPAGEHVSDYAIYVNTNVDRPLVADSPYELDLSGDRRRDVRTDDRLLQLSTPDNGLSWMTNYQDVTGDVKAFVAGVAHDTDDAPFAPADLERILRSYDADAGTLPSRLWDVVGAFDPEQLLLDNPYGVQKAANDMFDPTNRGLTLSDTSQTFLAAQQLAAVNRRLVTTDSYDLPVPGGGMPDYVSELGPDGMPGQAGVDDDPDGTPDNTYPLKKNGVIDDAAEIGAPNSDDFEAVTGRPLAQATLVDLLRYRVFLDRREKFIKKYIELQGWQQPLNATQLNEATAQANGQIQTLLAETNDLIQNQGLVSQLLAPEVIAGQRMDLNRPLGDGRDNGDWNDNDRNGLVDDLAETNYPLGDSRRDPYLNGIVDEPQEAGDPFLDCVNAAGLPFPDGKYEVGEPFIDSDGNGFYTPPRDRLWTGLTDPVGGPVTEPIGFDYTNGHGGPIRAEVATAVGYAGKVRNLSSQARQLYARQLYCLMMLLVDQGYVESLPEAMNISSLEGDTNLLAYVYDIAERRGHTSPTDEDRALALRKLTARRIAQWAINCVDFRDADAIMTPFEYDEDPWDGWGTLDRSGVLIPLDGDPATDENGNEKMLEVNTTGGPTLANNNVAQVIDWSQAGTGNRVVVTKVGTVDITGPTSVENQTRGLVWGTERPELLITETLALHNRRCTDEGFAGNARINDPPPSSGSSTPPDYDLDQRLKPQGSLFVELYNPWSPDGEKPAELYGRTDVDPNTPGIQPSELGVMLNRLSDVRANADGTLKRSPVWRMAVLQDPIGGRLTDQQWQLWTTDPDGYGVDMDRAAERWVYFTTGATADQQRSNDNNVLTEYTTVGGSQVPKVDNPNLSIWVPPLPLRSGSPDVPAARRYFIARTERDRMGANTPPYETNVDQPIAPILPGRYAVVGSSGMQLAGSGESGVNTPPTPDGGDTSRFVTSISRLAGGATDQSDIEHRNDLARTRRIELWPSANPDQQQLLIGANGGPEYVPDGSGSFVNVTDADKPGDPGYGVPDVNSGMTMPSVAIPVEDLNISEPVEGYPSLQYQALYKKEYPGRTLNKPPLVLKNGELQFETPYDHPLDLALDLVRNGTTQKYRTLHLQRLANPAFPWNPPPFNSDGTANVMHRSNLPVNPYLTIDSQSVDLTSYNGASQLERTDLPTDKARHDTPLTQNFDIQRDLTQDDFFAPLPASELESAPDHVLWTLIYLLKHTGTPPIIPVDAKFTVSDMRRMLSNDPGSVETDFLSKLDAARGGDVTTRTMLLRDRVDSVIDPDTKLPRRWDGAWGWSLLPRALPDDAANKDFQQRLNVKSLERGGHHFGYNLTNNQWGLDPSWVPRLLWKQERPDFMLVNADLDIRVSDLKNVRSRRLLVADRTAVPPEVLPTDNYSADDQARSEFFRTNNMFRQTDAHVLDFVLDTTLGFANEAYAQPIDRTAGSDVVAMMSTQKPGAPRIMDPTTVDAPEAAEVSEWNNQEASRLNFTPAQEQTRRQRLLQSTYPWLAWNDRPFAGADEIMQVPASSSSLMLHDYSVANSLTPNPYDGNILDDTSTVGTAPNTTTTTAQRAGRQRAPFGHLLNYFQTSALPATSAPDTADIDNDGNTTEWMITGAPNFYRILDYVQVPSRYVGTDTMLDPAVFNDVPTYLSAFEPVGTDIAGPDDPRYAFQPPFNKVSRERDPGRVNLNTVAGRRTVDSSGIPRLWSEVYDGIMHRYQDGNVLNPDNSLQHLGQFGPAWRDVVLSRRGYAQFNADTEMSSVDKPGTAPDTMTLGLNPNFPTFFANPFRSPDAGDLVPLAQMQQYGVDASWQRVHPYLRGADSEWGSPPGLQPFGDARDAGFGDDLLSVRAPNLPRDMYGGAIPSDVFPDPTAAPPVPPARGMMPLFSERRSDASIDATRNPAMMYQPMTRLANLVTTRSGVFAIWITVGYFEVEPAPDWNYPDANVRLTIRQRFGGNNNDNDDATIAARKLYDQVYPQGYVLGRELGSETGNTKRQRALFIVDRTQPVGFQPGEDLNVEDMIRVRRRIE